jgi:hypothetical protein
MVLITHRWEAGSRGRWPKTLKTKLARLSGSSSRRSYSSCDGQAGGWTFREAAKGTQVRVGKQLWEAKGPSQKTGIGTA